MIQARPYLMVPTKRGDVWFGDSFVFIKVLVCQACEGALSSGTYRLCDHTSLRQTRTFNGAGGLSAAGP